MLPTATKKRDGFLRKIDVLQRRLATLHAKTLDDLVSMAVNTLTRTGGRAHWSANSVRLRLEQLRSDTARLMGGTFGELVKDGFHAAVAVMKAAEKSRKREDQTDNEVMAAALLFMKQPKDYTKILRSKNMVGLSWDQQLAKSFTRTAKFNAIASELEQGANAGDIKTLRSRILPLIEPISAASQTIAQCEGIRIAQTAQQEAYKEADKATIMGGGLIVAGLIAGQTLHCACIPTSAEDHIERHLKYYKRIGPGEYMASDGERMPRPPYGHPGCLCWLVPEFTV